MVWFEQEQTQQRSTRHQSVTSVTNDNILIQAKQEYFDELLNLDGYQKRIHSLCNRYINLFDIIEKDDLDYEPKLFFINDVSILSSFYNAVVFVSLPSILLCGHFSLIAKKKCPQSGCTPMENEDL